MKKTLVGSIPPGAIYAGLENIAGESGTFSATVEKESVGTAIEFQPGQVLFPKLRPYLNKTHLAAFAGICSTEFHVLTPKLAQAEYLAAFLRSGAIVGITSLLMTGNTLPRLQVSDIEQLPIPIPPEGIQKEVSAKVSRLLADATALRVEADEQLAEAKGYIENLVLGGIST